jgi:2-polyprenyl-3-methyl-5-hydroxy-6-metoxy-1,4-benzoquinol methylase
LTATPSYVEFSKRQLRDAETELSESFGAASLEETAYSVYLNSFPPAAYLGWNRVVHAQRMLEATSARGAALDFGSGLGVMLPYLSQRYRSVVAYDLEPGPTALMVDRMRLPNVRTMSKLQERDVAFDAITALDVLEHVDDLHAVYAELLNRTAAGGAWVISGPTENWLYRAMRKLSRTTGEHHVRNVYDVLALVPPEMVRTASVRLPFGSPVPLFVVAKFERNEPTRPHRIAPGTTDDIDHPSV